MLLASNHMFPTGSVETIFERIAQAGAGGLDLFLPHVPYLTDGRFGPKNLELCRDAAAADLLTQRLRDHAFQGFRQHDADLRLPVGRELVDDAVHRARRRRGVKRSEHEVPRLGGLDGDGHRLEIPHLADEDDIGVLTERCP